MRNEPFTTTDALKLIVASAILIFWISAGMAYGQPALAEMAEASK